MFRQRAKVFLRHKDGLLGHPGDFGDKMTAAHTYYLWASNFSGTLLLEVVKQVIEQNMENYLLT
jgi:hypothetical protein